MYTGAALSFVLIRACRSGLVLYSIVLSHQGGENDRSSAISERSLLKEFGGSEPIQRTAIGTAPWHRLLHSVNISWWDDIECATGRRPFGFGVVMGLGVLHIYYFVLHTDLGSRGYFGV